MRKLCKARQRVASLITLITVEKMDDVRVKSRQDYDRMQITFLSFVVEYPTISESLEGSNPPRLMSVLCYYK